MEPNFHPGQYIFIDKFYWKLKWWIQRWDVVVVMPEQANVSYLKRAIWLPGETIEIKTWSVYLCKNQEDWKKYNWTDIRSNISYQDWILACKEIKQPYIEWKTVNIQWYDEKIVTTAKCGISKFTLWNWQYLVFGDDRMYSTDSRCCFRWFCSGKKDIYYITKDEILGRVWWFKF
jgi:signal peptidase I